MRSAKIALPLLLFAILGCDGSNRIAFGDANSIIVVAEDSLWAEVQDTILTTLQPTIFAVRSEPTFLLTHATPESPRWSDLRRFRQLLAIGQRDDPWVAEALQQADSVPTPPAIIEVPEVWARNQRVTVLLLPEEGAAAAARSMAGRLHTLLDRRYRNWAQGRMYISGHDSALADTLRTSGRFALDIPNVYRWRQVGDSAFMFLNDEPDAAELVRSLLVTWRSGTEGEPQPEAALTWRDSIASRFYDWGQTTQRDPIQIREVEEPGEGGLSIRGIWSGTLADFPQAGPFITRVIDCPAQDRRYLLDAWLYAPAKDKYQYMIQLETLLGSFRCGSA